MEMFSGFIRPSGWTSSPWARVTTVPASPLTRSLGKPAMLRPKSNTVTESPKCLTSTALISSVGRTGGQSWALRRGFICVTPTCHSAG